MDRVHKAATQLELFALVSAYPSAQARFIVGVGGGSGMLLAGLLN
jgi:hypothetical protein